LLAFTPGVLTRLRAGKSASVLATSVALWLLAQLAPMKHLDQLLIGSLPGLFPGGIHWAFSWFDLLGWQLLFVVGIAIGYHYLQGRLPRLITQTRPALFMLCVAVCATSFGLRHGLLPKSVFEELTVWADGRTLGPLRVLNLACLGYLLLHSCRNSTVVNRALQLRCVAYLGRHSLQVCVFHAVLCYGLYGLAGAWIEGCTPTERLLLLPAVLPTLWLAAVGHERWTSFQRRRTVARSRAPMPMGGHGTRQINHA
ncbi:MAG: OpgC domain-containing protein, partial [Deltaproteobacteria bacterium]|nr:OpgC domain-containing protein [Deltaproteobacteria bacterium]